MTLIETLLLALALAVDAAAVSMVSGLVHKSEKKERLLSMAVIFSVFQGLMPIIGYHLIRLTGIDIGDFSHFLIFLILGFLGLRMIFDFFKPKKSPAKKDMPAKLTYKWIILQAFGTSIDALAVGVGIGIGGSNIYTASLWIAAVTLILCVLGITVGKQFGKIIGNFGNIIGGVLLILLAVKALF